MTFLFFIGGAVVLATVIGYFVYAEQVLMEDADAPQHVARRDWDRVSERRDRW